MNWLSFTYGAVAGAALILVSGFFRAAGADAWNWLKRKISPTPQEVRQDYRPEMVCSWVQETRVPEMQDAGYQFYKKDRAICYRTTTLGKEFLMKKPAS